MTSHRRPAAGLKSTKDKLQTICIRCKKTNSFLTKSGETLRVNRMLFGSGGNSHFKSSRNRQWLEPEQREPRYHFQNHALGHYKMHNMGEHIARLVALITPQQFPHGCQGWLVTGCVLDSHAESATHAFRRNCLENWLVFSNWQWLAISAWFWMAVSARR